MLQYKTYLIFVLITAKTLALFGQSAEPEKVLFRSKTISSQTDSLKLDTLSIVPSSLQIFTKGNENGESEGILDSSFYEINYPQSLLIWQKQVEADSLLIQYRVFPFNLSAQYSHKSFDRNLKGEEKPFYEYKVKSNPESVFEVEGIDYNGSFSRGISIGNRQDLSVNSAFNLQFGGLLGKDVEVLGSISDNNLPFQTQGNTQQLQEFDKIFIQLKKDRNKLIVGDYQLLRPESYFMNFNKKLQGISFTNVSDLGNGEIESSINGAIARGRYRRMSIPGEEGNQGPYKLQGNNGENFIIVLSGTERVYVDGRLLTRGITNDYIIDYNLGEVFFTPNQLITKDRRIVIEFEYSQRNYLRSMVHGQTNYNDEKWSVNFNVYTEQDAKNQSGLQELSDQQKTFLSNQGDAPDGVFQKGINQTGYLVDRISYELIDTIINGQADTIFAYSNDPERAFFTLSFSDLGLGNGNYKLAESTANGRVFEWVAPSLDSGLPQGRYEPVIELVPPVKKQMLSLGAERKIKDNTVIGAEVSMSSNDLNTFSNIDDEDNLGLALNIYLDHDRHLDENETWSLSTNANYEFRQSSFRFLEDYRSIEFTRDWNVKSTLAQTNFFEEQIAKAGFSIKRKSLGELGYEAGWFKQKNNYDGFRNRVFSNINSKGFLVNAQVDFLSSESNEDQSKFIRPNFIVSKKFAALKDWSLGVKYLQENNKINPLGSDDLSSQSFNFIENEIFIRNPESSDNSFYISYQKRYDYKAAGKEFDQSTEADIVNFRGALSKNPKSQLLWNLTYRNLNVDENVEQNLEDDQTFLGLIEYNWAAWKGFVRSSTSYEISSGQQQKVDYLYTPVQANLGDYVWIDNNGNGIQENNEFELATINNLEDSVRFIRVVVPANEYSKTSKVRFNQSLNLSPKALWFNQKGIKKALSLFSFQSLWQLDKQFLGGDAWNLYNPFYENDSVLVSANSGIRNALFFRQGNPNFNAEIYFNSLTNKILLVNGTDGRQKNTWGSKVRFKVAEKWLANVNGETGFINNSSQAFKDRDYQIDYWLVQPKLTFQNGIKYRLSLDYLERRHIDRLNSLMDREALERSLNLEGRWNVVMKSTLNGRLSFVNIRFEDSDKMPYSTNNPAAFQILQGLNPGQNWVWALSLESQLMKNIQLVLQYNGKKSQDVPASHVGRVELRAVF